jgi:hypothetical protein
LIFEIVFVDGRVRFWPANGDKLVPAVLDAVGLVSRVAIVIIGRDAAVRVACVPQKSVVHLLRALDHRPVVPAAIGQRRFHDAFRVARRAASIAKVGAPIRVTNAAAASISAAAGAEIGTEIRVANAWTRALAVFFEAGLETCCFLKLKNLFFEGQKLIYSVGNQSESWIRFFNKIDQINFIFNIRVTK